MSHKVTNGIVAGLGGQGVLKGTDIIADVALRAGFDVEKSDITEINQRGPDAVRPENPPNKRSLTAVHTATIPTTTT